MPDISDECREEVFAYKVQRNSNINANVPLGECLPTAAVEVGRRCITHADRSLMCFYPAAKACKIDADKFCNVTWFFGYKSGQVIACLRDVKSQVSKPCKQQLFKVMLEVRRAAGAVTSGVFRGYFQRTG